MSDQQHMDDLFKQQLQDYAPSVPEGTFERIIEERKKRRVAIVWWRNWRNLKFVVIIITTALVAGGSYLFLKGDKNTATQSTEISQLNSSSMQPAANNEKAQNIRQADVQEQSQPGTAGKGDQVPTGITPGSSSTKAQTPIADKNSTGKNLPNNSATEQSPAKVQVLTGDNSSPDIDLSSSSSSAPAKNYNRLGKILGGKIKKAGEKTQVNTSALNIETADTDNDAGEPSSIAGQQIETARLYKMPVDLALITTASLADSNKALVTNSIKGPDCPEAEKNAAGNKTYWEAYTSVDYGSKKYTDTANSMFAAKRKETTSFYSAFSAGVRVTKVFNNGVSVRAGLNFSQINEKFSFVQSNTVQTTYIIDAITGDTTGSYIVRGTKYKTSFNNYRTLDIPLVLGYEVGNGRLHANFNAGAMVNVYSWQTGELLDTAFQPVSITTGKGLPAFQYKTNIGVGFTAGASVYYKLNDRLHLLAEPYFRYNFSPMNKEALSLQERFTTIGLRLGIRIDF